MNGMVNSIPGTCSPDEWTSNSGWPTWEPIHQFVDSIQKYKYAYGYTILPVSRLNTGNPCVSLCQYLEILHKCIVSFIIDDNSHLINP